MPPGSMVISAFGANPWSTLIIVAGWGWDSAGVLLAWNFTAANQITNNHRPGAHANADLDKVKADANFAKAKKDEIKNE